jgi:uncharacterized membrane protein (DUF485 family)
MTDSSTTNAAAPADVATARRIRRSAWLLGLLAAAFYVGFIVATAFRG